MTDYTRDIERYRKGELTPAERHTLERKALNDPFLADALEGSEQVEPADFSSDVEALVKNIEQKTSEKRNSVFMWPLRVAAALLLLSVCTYLVWNTAKEEPAQTIVLATEEKAAEPIKPQQSEMPVNQESRDESPTAIAENSPDVQSQKTEIVSAPVAATKPAEDATEAELVMPTPVTEPIAEVQPVLEITNETAPASASSTGGVAYKIDEAKKEALASDAESKSDLRSAVRSETGIGLRGTIVSAEDGSPLPGVNVVVKGSTIGTVSDEQGRYVIDAPPASTLVFSFIGLQSQELVQRESEANVSMSLDVTQLSEVVVTGYGGSEGETQATVNLAHPQVGYRAFKKYLEENVRYPQQAIETKTEGRVTIEFTVEPNGALANFNIVRGVGSGCDEELIRLVKEGPAWIPTKKEGIAVQDKVRVRLKFELPN